MVKEKTHNKNMTENKSTCVFFHTAISCLRNMFPKRIIRRGMKDRDRGSPCGGVHRQTDGSNRSVSPRGAGDTDHHGAAFPGAQLRSLTLASVRERGGARSLCREAPTFVRC